MSPLQGQQLLLTSKLLFYPFEVLVCVSVCACAVHTCGSQRTVLGLVSSFHREVLDSDRGQAWQEGRRPFIEPSHWASEMLLNRASCLVKAEPPGV